MLILGLLARAQPVSFPGCSSALGDGHTAPVLGPARGIGCPKAVLKPVSLPQIIRVIDWGHRHILKFTNVFEVRAVLIAICISDGSPRNGLCRWP